MAGSRDDLIEKRGKKLSAISYGIIVFIIAGGTFNKTGNFMGGGVSFEHPHYLKYFILIVFVYYLYKYWLINPKPISRFFSIVTNNTRGSDYLNNYIEEKSRRIIKTKIENGEKLLGKVWHDSVDSKPIRASVTNHSDAKPFIERNKTSYMIKASLFDIKGSQVIHDGNKYEAFKISIIRYYYYYSVLLLKFVFLNDRFSNQFNPYILSILAILFIGYEFLITI